MTLIKWREGYATHVAQFDDEHKRLVTLINDLAEAIRDKRGEEVLQHIFNELAAYVQTHFAHEEEEMARFGYPGLGEQQESHAKLKARVHELQERFARGDKQVIQELYELLRFWLIDHILEVDQKYGEFFQGKLPG